MEPSEATVKMSAPEKFYHSTLIPTNQSVSWTLHDITSLHNMGAWTAYSCTLEVPIGTHRISKWNVSVCEKNGAIYLRPRLIAPQNESVTFQLSVKLGGEMIAYNVSEISSKSKDKDLPMLELGTYESLLQKSVQNDQLELGLLINVFSQDLFETRE